MLFILCAVVASFLIAWASNIGVMVVDSDNKRDKYIYIASEVVLILLALVIFHYA